MAKFSYAERQLVKSLIASLTIQRIPDKEIIKNIFEQTNKTISERTLYQLRQSIKKDSYRWFTKLRQDRYSYIHEFKSLISDIMDLQKKVHQIIDANENNPQVQLSAIAELHRLNVTYSNYVEIIPNIIGNSNINGPSPISTNAQDKTVRESQTDQSTIIV